MPTTNLKPASSKIARLYYCKASTFTSYLDYGQNPTEAILDSAGDWKQLRMESELSQAVFNSEPFMIPQSSSEILSDYPQEGLQKPEVTVDQFHTVDFEPRHIDLLKSGFGTKVTATGSTTISTVTDDSTIIVASATGLAIGDIIKITDASDVFKGYAEITNVVIATLTLKNPVVGMVATDKVIEVAYYNTRTTEDDEYYHLFLTTDLGSFFIFWCKPSIDIVTTKDELAKITIKFQGDSILKTTKAVSDLTITTDIAASARTTFNFKRVTIGDDVCRSIGMSTFSITRENVRIPSQCSESMQGNGGTFNTGVKASLEVTLLKYPVNAANYYNGTQIKVVAYNDKIAIFGDGVISKMTEFNIADAQIRPTMSIELNAIESKPVKVVL